MSDAKIIHENSLVDGSRYAADFDYLMHDYVIERLRPFFLSGAGVELGAYHGRMTVKLRPFFTPLDVIEMDPVACEKIRAITSSEVKIFQEDFTRFAHFNRYRNIILSHSLEHVDAHMEFLRHIAATKQADARVFIVVPNGMSLSRQIAVGMGLVERPDAVTAFERQVGHYHTFVSGSLCADIENAGLNILEFGGVMPKIFSNRQYDLSLEAGIIDRKYLDACFALSGAYPEICASIFAVCT
jgi:hypothetical protein